MSQYQWEKSVYKTIDGLTRFASVEARADPPAPPPQAPAEREEPPASHAIVIAKNALNGGEISPYLGARFDQARYQTGCHSLLNMVPLPCGGVTKRPGFKYAGLAGSQEADRRVRLVPFVFSATESRVMEFYDNGSSVSLRLWRLDTRDGSRVLVPSEKLLDLPWQGDWLPSMSFCQSADVVYCAHENMPPARISRLADDLFKYEKIKWTPSIEPPVIRDGRWVGREDESAQYMRYYYRITAIDKETGEESLPSPIFDVGAQPLRQDHYVRFLIEARDDIAECRVYKRDGGVYGYVGSTTDKSGDDFVFEDKNIAADTADTPPDYRDPFDGPDKYPSLVFLHQQRLGFASSREKPLTVWLSPTGSYESMAASTPPGDDDAIEAALATSQANRVLWAVSDRRGLVIGTSGGEWILTASQEAALSPKNISFEAQSTCGSEPNIPPLATGNALLFVQRGGRVVRDLAYNYADDRYQSTDLSILARHILSDSPVVAWAWQQEPHGVVWMATENGELKGLTYLREHEIVAWHRHETAGQISQLVSIPAPEGDSVIVAAISRLRGPSVARHIEWLAPFPDAANPPWHKDGIDMASYPARCVPCIGAVDAGNGSSFGRPLKINAVKARVLNSRPFKCRVISQYAAPGPVRSVPARPANPPGINPAANGAVSEADWACPIGAGFRDNARIELILDGPEPATILGLAITLEFAQTPGGQI